MAVGRAVAVCSEVQGDTRPEDVRPAAAPRWRRLAVIDREVPLELGIGIKEPVQAEHEVVQRGAVDALILRAEVAVAQTTLPRSPAVFPVQDVEITQRNDAI